MTTMNLLLDYLNYTSYKQQRDNGMSAEDCAKIYSNAYAMECRYQLELKQTKQ